MKYRNSFFQLLSKHDGTYIKVFPAMDDGKMLAFEEVTSYLSSKKITDFPLRSLENLIVTVKAPTELKLLDKKCDPINESVKVKIDEGKKKAIGRFYPPSNTGQLITKEEIFSELSMAGVKYGILEENIERFLKARKYCTDILLAKAKEPREGKDAKIIYYFNTNINAKPKVNEDGSVDFHQLDIISHVNKGDVLAKLEPMDRGEPGIDLLGNPIKQRSVSNLLLKHGANIHLSEDGLIMYSDVDGHVSLAGDKVFVSDTYEVPADVDNSTGDIVYDGNVLVKGNVINGFTIKAKGDIIVEGVVEGAHLISESQIILKRGIQGMNRGILDAKGNIVTKFIENSTVKAGGYVTTEAILHSHVSASGDIVVNGRRGFVTGGEIRSGTMISVKTAGSTMGTATLLEVGIDPAIVDEFHKIEKEMEKMKEELEKVSQVLTLFKKRLSLGEKLTPDKVAYLKASTVKYEELKKQIGEHEEKYSVLAESMENNEGGRVKIEDVAYQGVHIIISNVNYFVRKEEHHCQYVKDKADIKSLQL